ncbi:Protein of unknown function [Anaplasma phagocytophilum]|uniref:Uncharacterized protein n=1 Tax=Anaplasma phagocytophilum TaxID=948 RepID=A0A098GMD7_ANAPH|nr:Protein of unknown function [Anaplasma phagocytophilum]
MHATVPWE